MSDYTVTGKGCKRREVTDADRKQWAWLYKAGWSYWKIAAEYDRVPSLIRKYVILERRQQK